MRDRFIIIRDYEHNDYIKDVKSEHKFAKIEAETNPEWDEWKDDLKKWIRKMENWNKKHHVDKNGKLLPLPIMPCPPKPFSAKRTDLTEDEAMKIVEECGLVEKVNDENGKIWDTPNGDFQLEFKRVIDCE